MIIIGIDTALRCTGYGIIRMESLNDISILDCGIIKNAQSLLHSECLRRISGGVKTLIKEFKPDIAVLEDAFYRKNVKTAMILSLARGAAITAFAEADIPVYAYSPRIAKKAVTGMGEASKEQVASLLSSMLSIDVSKIPDDSTDALALAICHGQNALRPGMEFLIPSRI